MALLKGFLTLLIIFSSCLLMESFPHKPSKMSSNYVMTVKDSEIENSTSPTFSYQTINTGFSQSNSTTAKVTSINSGKVKNNNNSKMNITIRRSDLDYNENEDLKIDENFPQTVELDEHDEFWSTKHSKTKFPDDDFQDVLDHHIGVTPHSEKLDNDNYKFMGNTGKEETPACRHGTICEDVPNYPSELISEAVRSNSSLKVLEIVDQLTEGRRGPDDADELCLSREHISRPRSALSKDNKWLYVLNDESFEQSIRVEICKVDDSPCQIIDSYPNQYKVTCKQKYIYRQMAALDSGGSVTLEAFRIPSSCCCHAKFEPNLSRSRFNQHLKNMTPIDNKSRKVHQQR